MGDGYKTELEASKQRVEELEGVELQQKLAAVEVELQQMRQSVAEQHAAGIERVSQLETAAAQATALQETLAAREEQLAASAQREGALESELQTAQEKMGGTEGEMQALLERVEAYETKLMQQSQLLAGVHAMEEELMSPKVAALCYDTMTHSYTLRTSDLDTEFFHTDMKVTRQHLHVCVKELRGHHDQPTVLYCVPTKPGPRSFCARPVRRCR